MWVLNNNLENAEFTGDRTKLVAFNRADGSHNERLTFDIQDVIQTGQGICGNATHMWVLGDGWLCCWTHAGVRTPGRDVRVAAEAVACDILGTDFHIVDHSGMLHVYSNAGVLQHSTDLKVLQVQGYSADILTSDLLGSRSYVLYGGQLSSLTYATRHNPAGLVYFNCRTEFQFRGWYRYNPETMKFDIPYLSPIRVCDSEPQGGSTTVGWGRENAGFAFSSDDSWDDWTGLFRDDNDLWVIEPTLPVAAKFTVQSDGSIARNLS